MLHAHATARERHPRLSAYLAGLGDGLQSWPQHRAKASLLRAGLRTLPLDASAIVDAPPRLQELVERPPVDSAWITEVEYCAFSLLVADVHDLDNAAFGNFWYEVMDGLVQSQLYAVMLRWISAKMLLRTTAARWGAFHRGLELVASGTADGMRVELRFPDGMVPPLCIEGYTHVWQALIDHSSSHDAVAQLLEVDRGRALYQFDGFL